MKVNLKSYGIIFIFLFTYQIIFSQSLQTLKEDRGYKEIKLGSNINQYNCFERIGKATGGQSLVFATAGINQSKISVHKFVPNSDYPYYKIGDVDIFEIMVTVHVDRIMSIKFKIEKNNDILPLLKYRYGPNTSYKELVMSTYKWETNDGIVCSLNGYGGIKGMTTYAYILEFEDIGYMALLKEKSLEQREANSRAKEKELRNQARTSF